VIRYRFDDDTIARLNALAWWDWPVEQISQNLPLISGGEITALEAVTR
jgi:virginiamycin A acetyltransferase